MSAIQFRPRKSDIDYLAERDEGVVEGLLRDLVVKPGYEDGGFLARLIRHIAPKIPAQPCTVSVHHCNETLI
jgi:hypothetical protein